MGIPLAALAVQQPPNIADQYGKALAIKGAQQNQAYQAQAQPLELQERQQQMQSGAIDLQLKQENLRRQRIVEAALTDPNFSDDIAKPKNENTPQSQPAPVQRQPTQ